MSDTMTRSCPQSEASAMEVEDCQDGGKIYPGEMSDTTTRSWLDERLRQAWLLRWKESWYVRNIMLID